MSSRPVSIKDVADRAGVAVGTVSNVLNHPARVSDTTRSRVQSAIDELGFVRNDAARQLRAGQSRTIGLIVLDVGNPFFSSLARAAEDCAAENGSTVVLGDSGQDPGREARYLDVFEQQRVQGMLVSPVGDLGVRIDELRGRGTPVVLVDRVDPQARCSSVSVDDVAGGYLAVRHLLDAGRRRIVFVGARAGYRQVTDRLTGARQAVGECAGAVLEVLEAEDMTVLAGREVGEVVARRSPAELPDGIFCANDLLAIGVMQAALLIRDLRVPEDLALIGYDDIDFATSTVVPLTSVRKPTELMGRTAVELLLEQIEDPDSPRRQVVFHPELVERGSTTALITAAG
ncbi:LacI family transcriptional regulator [Arthrobacter sp. RIT-PI-e]|uniref:LacI family DNA-binding transcriptional regulator n=1 Tax=Arthrobacter sp. RIT-PI-e TaxID=1681197 RepID=UPI0006766F98|nr:LacI family DNA-binding transcriptional regulator [Arthrobacter sp. RIT-PI-e]KNC18460.1 LacI family transcriptional regulator [Arthrobacter sp. RIT-PI-e]